jgi:transposase
MLMIPKGIRVFMVLEPFNMRGGCDSAAGVARRLGLEPIDGGYYVFLSRRRTQIAVVHFDGSAWCTFRKRLERGTFALPEVESGASRVDVEPRVLASILDGIDLRAPRRRWYEHGRTAVT